MQYCKINSPTALRIQVEVMTAAFNPSINQMISFNTQLQTHSLDCCFKIKNVLMKCIYSVQMWLKIFSAMNRLCLTVKSSLTPPGLRGDVHHQDKWRVCSQHTTEKRTPLSLTDSAFNRLQQQMITSYGTNSENGKKLT